jgi:minor extracellular serine protease Vpr
MMNRNLERARTVLAFALFTAFSAGSGLAQAGTASAGSAPNDTIDASVNETATKWFVQLASAPTADGGSLGAVRNDKTNFRKAAKAAGISFKERYAFDSLFNGISIQVAPKDLGKVSRLDGVVAMYPVVTEAPEPLQVINTGSDPDMSTALGMTGADIAQNTLGLSGAGVKVAIIDSGIDFDHPDFGGNGVPGDGINPDPNFGPTGNSRVKFGWDFVGDDYDAANAAPGHTPVPDANPDSCRDYNGSSGEHGTHVAGIAGASGFPPAGVRGVAPGVTFGSYRVFGCNGSTDSDIMVAAMERALADGMQVINMSIGSSYQWPQYPTAVASDRMVNKGIVVVASIGNSGTVNTQGFSAGAPGTGAKVIGVASFDNTFTHQPAIAVNGVNYGYNTATAAPPPPTTGTFPLARIGTKTTANAGCNALAAGSLAGQVALIRRGTCSFNIKSANAMNAGAVGVVLYNNAAGALSPTVVGPPTITIPVVALTQADGNAIDDLLAIGPQNMTWTSQTDDNPQATAGLISDFSSWGMAADLSLKPDIGAPGGSIRSTFPIEYGSYASISGTSMASPHVAGAVALLLEAKPHTASNAVRDILQNAAIPHLWSGNTSYGILDAAHRQGAGMLNVPGAVLATTHVTPGKLSLGESQFGPVQKSLKVTNSSGSAETYDLSYEDAISTIGSYTLGFDYDISTVVFSQAGLPVSSISVPAGGSATLDVSIAPGGVLTDQAQYGGYVYLTPQSSSDTVRVPYAGYKGDYQAIQVLKPTASNFPWLARTTNGSSFSKDVTGTPYTMVGFDQPNIVAHFDHQSRKVRFEIFSTSGKSWQRAFPDFDYFGKNSTATGIFAFAWDGTTVNGAKSGQKTQTVPNGTYVIKLSVLKALGDENNPAHWETFTSPVITVARP